MSAPHAVSVLASENSGLVLTRQHGVLGVVIGVISSFCLAGWEVGVIDRRLGFSVCQSPHHWDLKTFSTIEGEDVKNI